MRDIITKPENVYLPEAGNIGKPDILQKYRDCFSSGNINKIPSVFLIRNNPNFMKEYTSARKIKKEHTKKVKEIANEYNRKTHDVESEFYKLKETPKIRISPDDKRAQEFVRKYWAERHDIKGGYQEFLEKWNNGDFMPLYFSKEEEIIDMGLEAKHFFYYNSIMTEEDREEILNNFKKEKRIKTENVEGKFNRSGYERMRDIVENWRSLGKDAFLLIDGNHRSLAATLEGYPIQGILLENDEDVKDAYTLSDLSIIKTFGPTINSLKDLTARFYDFANQYGQISVAERVEYHKNCYDKYYHSEPSLGLKLSSGKKMINHLRD